MKLHNLSYIFLIFAFLTISCTKKIPENLQQKQNSEFGIVIHGGAGWIYKGRFSSEQEKAYSDKLAEALKTGYEILANGGDAVDAVEKTINILENSPDFNAGKGAVFAANGLNELDASIMNGKDLNAGGVAGLHHIKNPISLARLVMEKSPHVLMAGDGAEEFAKQFDNIEFVDTKYFFTEERWESLKKAQESEIEKQAGIEKNDWKFGTVGCVVLDKNGNLAAGTSTGGMTNKKFGRIGDSPIIGAGTYADNNTCAVSATGHGEYFIRNVVAYDISALMKYKNLSLQDAAQFVINDKLKKQKGDGGVIAIDKFGNIAMPFNTQGMFRAFMLDDGIPVIKLYGEIH